MHEQQGSSVLLTPAQEAWLSIQRVLANAALDPRYPPPPGKLRAAVFAVVTDDVFEAAVMGLIILNVLMLAMVHYGMASGWQVRFSAFGQGNTRMP
jgi:hypothetical protein